MGASGIEKIGVIGIGLMGSGIAQVSATYGFDTVVADMSDEVVRRGMARGDDCQHPAPLEPGAAGDARVCDPEA